MKERSVESRFLFGQSAGAGSDGVSAPDKNKRGKHIERRKSQEGMVEGIQPEAGISMAAVSV